VHPVRYFLQLPILQAKTLLLGLQIFLLHAQQKAGKQGF